MLRPVDQNSFRAIVDIEVIPGINQSTRLLTTKTALEIGVLFDYSRYVTEDNMPNAEGMRVMTAAFIQGLISNIRVAHANGWWDESKQMQHVFDELNKAFVDTVKFEISKDV